MTSKSGTQEFAERASVLSYGPRHILLALLLGIPLAVLSALVLFVLVTDPASLSSNDKKLASLCLVLFAAMLWVLYRVIRKGLRGMRRSRLLKQYLDLIVNKGYLALDDLVILTGRSMDAVVEDVGDMIRLGFLPEHKIDSTAHILSLEPISKLLEQDAQVRKPHEAEETGWLGGIPSERGADAATESRRSKQCPPHWGAARLRNRVHLPIPRSEQFCSSCLRGLGPLLTTVVPLVSRTELATISSE